jgi:alpha-L-fucosidase 2
MKLKIKHQCLGVLCGIALWTTANAQTESEQTGPVRYNVTWDSPSKDFNGSMPIGNGDIGANVWVEDGGDFLFYISKTDAWSENARLLKLGKIRLRLTPNPFAKGCQFKQELDLKNGVIKISSSTSSPGTSVDLRFWIDANNPVIRVTGKTSTDTKIEMMLEHWRTQRTEVAKGDLSFSGLVDRDSKGKGFAYPLFIEPDTLVETNKDKILWFHRNKKNAHSVWEDTLEIQGLGGFMKESGDPLLNLTFGALVQGEGMANQSASTLESASVTRVVDFSVFPLTSQTPSAQNWIDRVEGQAAKYKEKSSKAHWAAHKNWWHDFWSRSWINIDAKPGSDGYIVARGYALQNWISACSGRGNMPIKFNGSIFTVDGIQANNQMPLGPDYRAWGPCYWWQNTRLPYWPMLASGNYDMMKPLFKMYLDALPLAIHRVRKYHRFDGAYFPETIYFWGAHSNQDYGWHPKKDRHPDKIRTPFIQYEWQGGIELTAMMLQYYQHTGDNEFLKKSILPLAKEIVTFYDKRYSRNDDGKLEIYPANALEDVWECTNPTPEVAGLRFILPQLIKLTTDQNEKQFYTRMFNDMPELESAISETGKKFILPARKGKKRRGNCEKPECYAVFPYRLYGVGLPDLDVAKETFRLSPTSMKGQSRTNGWAQDPIFAACVGDTHGAAQRLVTRSKLFHEKSRFPAFWGPNFDWVPDQDHGGVNMIALQHMLMQTEPSSDKIHLCPAWPKDWDCSFKLHAPRKTTVQGEIKKGKVINLIVTPKSRAKDIINHLKEEKY